MRSFVFACGVASLAAACSGGGKSAPPPVVADPKPDPSSPEPVEKTADQPPAPKRPQTLAEAGIVPEWMERSADPCTDFYQYACGGFLKTAEIPPDRSSWGAIQIVVKGNEDLLRKTLEDAQQKHADDTMKKLGAYYGACMDEAAIEKAGIAPVKPLLDVIATVVDGPTAAKAVIALHKDTVFPFFTLGPTQDFADATKVIAGLDQGGLGLPDRKYYFDNTGTMPRTRKAYAAHLQKLFELAGTAPPASAAAAADVMRIETAIAKVQQTDITRRDPHAVYHRVDRDGLEKKVAPTFPWGAYLSGVGIAGVTAITVNDPAYYTAIAKLIATEKPAALRNYLTATVLRDAAPTLTKAFVDQAFAMQKELSGAKELPPRWRRCVRRVDADLGELLAQSYVKTRFAGSSRARAIDLTRSVLDAMRTELDALPWMDDTTRAAAKTKLDKMAYLVGFPDKWRRYDFAVGGEYATNVVTASRWELARQLGKIGKPVDRNDWQMTPPTVNAYYDPTLNEIALPAGQLQPPFFSATFHPAVNFGSTGGGTVGHEVTHGFDDEGSQFDGDGNLRDWWSKSTKEQFAAATKCVVDQYAKYEAVPKVKLDGKLTAGENIADNGGVKIAYLAYQAWKAFEAKQGRPVQTKIEDLTDDQVYFLAYGQSWCDKMTPEALETMAHSNPHAPPMWRVNGVIVNQPGFGPAYSCPAGKPMNPGKPCSVW
ncbi:MAG: M13 family peptidase [Deltaproteobacteria bacterium]|nr:M13 family peptidase [Deltaproteobacteria bacterium]